MSAPELSVTAMEAIPASSTMEAIPELPAYFVSEAIPELPVPSTCTVTARNAVFVPLGPLSQSRKLSLSSLCSLPVLSWPGVLALFPWIPLSWQWRSSLPVLSWSQRPFLFYHSHRGHLRIPRVPSQSSLCFLSVLFWLSRGLPFCQISTGLSLSTAPQGTPVLPALQRSPALQALQNSTVLPALQALQGSRVLPSL